MDTGMQRFGQQRQQTVESTEPFSDLVPALLLRGPWWP